MITAIATGATQTLQERIREMEGALQAQPNDVTKLVALGRLYAESGRIPDGLKLLEKAVVIDPNSPVALSWLGSLQVRMTQTTEDLGERLQWFKKGTRTMDEAVEQFPNAAVVYIVRGISGVNTPDRFHRYVVSIQDFNKVLELKTRDPASVSDEAMPTIYLNLGLAYKKNHQKTEAKAIWEKGRHLYPQAEATALMEKELNNL